MEVSGCGEFGEQLLRERKDENVLFPSDSSTAWKTREICICSDDLHIVNNLKKASCILNEGNSVTMMESN